METTTPTQRKPFIVHRRPPGLHWWTDHHGRDHGPYVHHRVARRDAVRARKHRLRELENEMGVA